MPEALADQALEAYYASRTASASCKAQAHTAQEVLDLIHEVLGDIQGTLKPEGAYVRLGHFLFLSDISYEHGHGLLCKWTCDKCGDFGGEVRINTLTALGFVESKYREHRDRYCRPDAR
jgi:hypothetical protein